MALTVIGGSNFLGRYLIKSLLPAYPEVRLGDMYPFRQSVYRLQESLTSPISKHVLAYPTSLRMALDGAQDVIVVTHDYFKLAHSKNFYLEKTALIAKEFGVKRLIWVGPMELDHLSTLDGDPDSLTVESEAKAREAFPDLISLRTNLIFGENCMSLIINKALEDLSAGKKILTFQNGNAKFAPVFEEDLLNTIKKMNPGESSVIKGPEDLKYSEIVKLLAAYCGVPNPSHSNAFESIKGKIASSDTFGDVFYPSHLQQLYRLLKSKKETNANIIGTTKITDFFAPGKFQGVQNLNWHRVILD